MGISVRGFSATLETDSGVFSPAAVDTGTVQLLREAPAPPAAGNLLDLGCGYGPIACFLASTSPLSTVWAVDVNERALSLTRSNCGALGLGNVRVGRPTDVPADLRFDGIWSNPPIRIGKAALHGLLLYWLPRLHTGSAAWLVVQRNLGSDSLAGWLQAEGWRVQRLASRKGYRVLGVRSE